ncbi:olfactory receptor 8A1-like [Discoglossus pictus]
MYHHIQQTNETVVIYFIIKGVSDIPELQLPIVLLIFLIYLLCVGGNATILLVVTLDSHLHTPMYFFLGNLSILDMSSATVTLHKILLSFISGDNTVSYTGCLIQLYMFGSFETAVLFMLTVMSYDRYVAICKPLYYHMDMNPKVCVLIAAACWGISFTQIIPTVSAVSLLTCFKSNIINHFFCDMLPLRKLTCSDTFVLDLYMFVEGGLIAFLTPFTLTFVSYVFIIMTILKIRSSTGRRKAFYTCSSHLTVVILLYVTIFFQYLTPTATESLDLANFFSLFNTAAVPVLNPLIYSLKNKDVKSALRQQMRYFKVNV